ncbi:transforming growth factor-beta-induced ig-h3 [Fusarium subglutinans]|uniref:Transforming growth factor-beta-induced ig-h3 n=1 Tax=Gibberella subglutinans TaxID=42677 RepID=A0A8H5QEM2_GIBSU|nr:transforming growth factor-beta-induced ig-h3 [Fusarium subglutinans]KAF5613854.1 transforming growth factor-beta-induced ig-h3 [Fusarium subglutinans]
MKFLNLAALASAVVAQSDLASILSSQSDLSTLAELLALVPDIAETLASASNITIFAPTNDAFASVPRDIPEGEAISQRNDTIAIGALLSNHVFKGYYPAKVATDIPVFVQSLLDSSFVNYRQPFGNFTGGQYNGIVKDGDDVVVISGEETLSYVTEADIKVGDSAIIHKVDKPLSFGPPLQLFTRRDNLLNFNAALNAADLPYNFGNLDRDSSTLVNISDFTVFIPNDAAFEAIGSVLESADLKTLQEVLKYHIVDDVLFSTDLANVSVPSLQGADLTFTVAEDGSAWVNGAKILFTNVLLFNGVAHVIDGVLNPADDPFDRADLKPAADADDRLAFPGATPVSKLPFSVISYVDDSQPTYTTPELLKTLKAIDVSALATATSTADATTGAGETTPTPTGVTPVVNAASSKFVAGGASLFAVVIALLMV